MTKMCISCFDSTDNSISSSRPNLCAACSTHLRKLARNQRKIALGRWSCRSLFAYDDPIRSLVMRAKVQSDHQAITCIEQLFQSDCTARGLALWCDAIVTAPSSLWGRLRGRFDLAYFIAAALAESSDRPLLPAPRQLYWRIRKRARMQNRSIGEASKKIFVGGRCMPLTSSKQRLLIIDDIVTTGHTLMETASALESSSSVDLRFLTLASAFNERTKVPRRLTRAIMAQ